MRALYLVDHSPLLRIQGRCVTCNQAAGECLPTFSFGHNPRAQAKPVAQPLVLRAQVTRTGQNVERLQKGENYHLNIAYASVNLLLVQRAIGSGVEHILHTDGVAGSNPASPTNNTAGQIMYLACFLICTEYVLRDSKTQPRVSRYRHTETVHILWTHQSPRPGSDVRLVPSSRIHTLTCPATPPSPQGLRHRA